MRSIARLLAAWRQRVAATGRTREGSVARADAERSERRARWAYEDESIAQHDRHGRPEGLTNRLARASSRQEALRQDQRDRQDRPARLADEAEIERELDESP